MGCQTDIRIRCDGNTGRFRCTVTIDTWINVSYLRKTWTPRDIELPTGWETMEVGGEQLYFCPVCAGRTPR
jgi:hypothetical protein